MLRIARGRRRTLTRLVEPESGPHNLKPPLGLPEAWRTCGKSGFPLQVGDFRLVSTGAGSAVPQPQASVVPKAGSARPPLQRLSAAGAGPTPSGGPQNPKEGWGAALGFCGGCREKGLLLGSQARPPPSVWAAGPAEGAPRGRRALLSGQAPCWARSPTPLRHLHKHIFKIMWIYRSCGKNNAGKLKKCPK